MPLSAWRVWLGVLCAPEWTPDDTTRALLVSLGWNAILLGVLIAVAWMRRGART